jgi:hypothetical protein
MQTSTEDIVEYGDYVYYINKNDNNHVYRMKKDGSENTKLANSNESDNLKLIGNELYFTNVLVKALFKMNFNDLKPQKVLDIPNYNNVSIYNNLIYYIGEDKLIHSVGLDGKGDKVISRDKVYDYWINDNYIYYKITSEETQYANLWRIKLDGSGKENLLSGINGNLYSYFDDVKFVDGYAYLLSINNAYGYRNEYAFLLTDVVGFYDKQSFIYEKYCYRLNLNKKEKIEKLDMEDTYIDYNEDENTWHYSIYNKLYAVEKDGIKELDAKLPSTKVLDIDEDYIYFMDYSDYICRVKKDGTGRERILQPQEEIYGDFDNSTEAHNTAGSKDYIYYRREGTKLEDGNYYGINNLGKVKKDGSENIILQKGNAGFFPNTVINDKMYAVEWQYPYFNIIEVTEGTDSSENKILADDCSSSIYLNNGWIYYFSDDNTLKRVNLDGTKKETVDNIQYSYGDKLFMYGDYLYGMDSNYVWRRDLKNNTKFEYVMPIETPSLSGKDQISPIIAGVDDEYVYTISIAIAFDRYDIFRTSLKTKKSELIYTTNDRINMEPIGIINGKLYFRKKIYEVKK